MLPEDALLAYLYTKVVAALQAWRGIDDIYGIWMGLALPDERLADPELGDLRLLREATEAERTRVYGSRWSPGTLGRTDDEVSFSPALCSSPWPPDEEEYASILLLNGIHTPGDPEGRGLRDAYFAWKRTQPGYLDPHLHPEWRDLEYQELTWFIEICGKVIAQLHQSGHVRVLCGHPLPVGIFFWNDLPSELIRATVTVSNPVGLSQGMVEWL